MPKEIQTKKLVKAYSYTRKDGKKVNVPAHYQNYTKRPINARPISMEEAKRINSKRSAHAIAIDNALQAKTNYDTPNSAWSGNINRSDVQNIDSAIKKIPAKSSAPKKTPKQKKSKKKNKKNKKKNKKS